jgi:hypothetical protein
MKFEVGDKVVVKHSNEDAVVRELINDKMVMVEVRGVKFPVYNDQLSYPYFKMFSEQLKQERKPAKKYIEDIRKEKNAPKYKVAEGVWLLFFPVFNKDVFDDDVVESLKIYLVNQTDAGLKFHFWLRLKGEIEMELQNEVLALSDFYLMDIDFEQLNDNPSFDFEFSLLSGQKEKAEYFEASYRPKARQVFKQVEQIRTKGEAFFSSQLFAKYPERPVSKEEPVVESPWSLNKLSEAGFKVVNNKRIHAEPPPPSVLDLHIEKLTDNYAHMSSQEKLTLQLSVFEKYLNKAELNYLTHVFVIHGIGKGRLKEEIHEILKHRPGVKSFVQQYHPWYGNGATEIYFK